MGWVELRGVPYDEQWEILRAIVEGVPRFGGGVVDGGGNGGWLGEKAVTYFGEQVFQALHLKESWYAEFLPRFRRSFEEHQILVPATTGCATTCCYSCSTRTVFPTCRASTRGTRRPGSRGTGTRRSPCCWPIAGITRRRRRSWGSGGLSGVLGGEATWRECLACI